MSCRKIYLLIVCIIGCISAGYGQLTADFSADPRSGCAPIRVVFVDNSTGNPDRYRWDLGNGTISTAPDPSTTYFTPGVYTIRLTVYRGSDSATVTKTNYVSVYAIPTVDFEGTPLTGCVPLPVQFTDKSVAGSGNLVNWQWDFGDGNIGSGRNPVHNYKTGGTYKVTLTVRNSLGCVNSTSRLDYVRVNDSLRAKFGFKVPPTCKLPVTVQFTDSSVGVNIRTWSWDFGDGGTSNSRNPLHTYTTAGSFTVRLIVTNSAGCVDTLIKPGVISAGDFKADFNLPSNGQLCVGRPTVFSAISGNALPLDSARWFFSDGTSYKANILIKSFANPGTYTVRMLAYAGGCVDSVTKSLNVQLGPTANFDANPTGACKPPLEVSFRNLTSNGTVLRWNFGNGATSTDENPKFTYTTYGSFDVTLIVRNATGCLDTLVKPGLIKLFQPKINSIKGLPWKGCFPHTHNFDLDVTSPDPIVKWEWDFGDGNTSTDKAPSHTYSKPGVYDVRAIITTAQGCTDTILQELKGGVRPKSQFRAEPLLVCPEDEVFYFDSSKGIIDEWFWLFGDGGTSYDINPKHQYNDTGWMNVTLITSYNGCADTLRRERYIYVNPPLAIFQDSFSCANQFERFYNEYAVGATYWLWKFGDGDSAEVRNTIHMYRDTGRFRVSLTVADSVCKHTTNKLILILDEKANIETEDSGSCVFTKVNFYARGPRTHPGNIAQYEWTFDNGRPIITDTNWIAQSYSRPGVVKVKLKITDLNGCTDSTVQDITVRFYGPKANFGPAFQAACAGSFVGFTDSTRVDPTNPVVKWTWNFGFGNNQTFTNSPFGTVYPDPGVYDVKLIVEDKLGCKDSILRKRAVVIYKPNADFISPDTLVCVNSLVDFVNQSTGSKLKYQWSFGNGRTDTATNPVTRYTLEGKYDVRLIVSDTINCKDTLFRPKYITVEDAEAAFKVTDSFTTCPPLLVGFTNESRNHIQSFWSFGNGNTSTLVSPSHTYTFPGVFTAKLVVVGNGGCKDSATKTIRIQGPLGNIRYGPLAGCPPLRVSFASTAINTKFYTWDFSDGQSDFTSDSTTTHTYMIPGTYVPRLILEDGLGCKLPVPGPDTIHVFGAKAYIKKLPRLDFCDSALISFFDSTITTDVVVRYRWQFGDGQESSERNPVHFYARPGRYRAIFEVWTANNCYTTDTLPVPIVVAEGPQVDFAMSTPVCVPGNVRFSAQWLNPDTSSITWRWDFGNGLSSNQATPTTVSYLLPGNFNVRLFATNNYGCADTMMKALMVNDTPRVQASPFSYLCLGNEATLQASGAATYRWDPNPTLSCLTCPDPMARPSSQQIYRVVGTDSNGCISSDTVLVKVKMPGVLSYGPGDTICVGESVQLRSQGFELLRWSPPAGLSGTTIPNPIARPTTTTTYTITGTDSLGCFTDSGKVAIVVYPIPQFNIIETVIRAEIGTQVELKTTSSPDITRWRWTPPVGLSCNTCPIPFATVGGLTMTYEAEVSNPGGCTASDEVTIIPICVGENIFIPNTFSPNGDGNNDMFYPRGKGLASIKSMRIFNRWGEVMFERKDFALNDPSAGWNGTNKGVLLTPDVYVYTMEVLCANNEQFSVKGNVTLLR